MIADVFPTRATFRPEDPVAVIVITEQPAAVTIEVRNLGVVAGSSTHDVGRGRTEIALGSFPPGGFHVAARSGERMMSTAFDVLHSPMDRPRYGFLSDFPPDRDDLDELADDIRRLHLNVIQFYDWMYRHDELLPQADPFEDLLGRQLSMATVRRSIEQLGRLGAVPIAYGAVYGASFGYADAHPEQSLYRNDGSRWSLGDLLAIMNLDADRGWASHIIGEFAGAVDAAGFAGIHLDQYGDPKLCLDADGRPADLALQFPDFIGRVRDALPEATLIFNNVNNYPTWATASAPQDATYIEVWSPHDSYTDLADLVTDARRVAPGRPVILAAYLEPFTGEDPDAAAWAARLALATVFSHGGHYLLCGERQGVLVHPYYPKYETVDATTMALLRHYMDTAVAMGDILYDPTMQVVTKSMFAGVNNDVQVHAPVPVSPTPDPGALWIIVTESASWTVVHLIDLSQQNNTDWNVPKEPGRPLSGVTVEISQPTEGRHTALVSTPGTSPQIQQIAIERSTGDHVRIEVPSFEAWATIALPRAAVTRHGDETVRS